MENFITQLRDHIEANKKRLEDNGLRVSKLTEEIEVIQQDSNQVVKETDRLSRALCILTGEDGKTKAVTAADNPLSRYTLR